MPAQLPDATGPFDASEGLLRSWELAKTLRVERAAAGTWARNVWAEYGPGNAAVMRTPGGEWRWSARWVRENLFHA